MRDNCKVDVPTLEKDKCKGCYTSPDCITVENNISFLGVFEGDSYTKLIDNIVEKLKQYEQRIILLENELQQQ